MVARAQVLNSHSTRRISSRAAFRSIDTCESGRINDYMLEKYVRKYMVRGREKGWLVHGNRRQDVVVQIVAKLMYEMDEDKDGIVSIDDFMAWSRKTAVEHVVDSTAALGNTGRRCGGC